MGKYTPVRMVSDIINVPTLSVLVPVLNYGPLVIIQNVYSATTCCLHFSPHTTILLEVVVLLLLVLYYSVLGVTMVAYVDAHRVSMGNTTTVPVLHMPNTSSTCRMAWCLCSYAHSCLRMSAISQLHMNRLLMPLDSSSTTTHARCVEQWRGMVPGDVQKQCALPWPPGCATERVRVQMDEHSTWRCF